MQVPTVTWKVLSSTVDYYAATTDDPEIGRWTYERARDYIEVDRLGDFNGSGASIQGYFGISSDTTFVGEREGSTYIRLSSTAASDRWLDFADRGCKATRIDVCATVLGSQDVPDLAYQIRYGGRLPARIRGKLPELSLYSTEGKGDTLYVGSTGSDRRGRLYDKGRESQGAYPVGTWRYEVQSRHGYAEDVSNALGRRNIVAPWIQTYVREWFLDRGIPASFPAWEPAQRDTRYREPTSDDRRVEYLKKSIRPMIERLRARYSVRQLREILGLQYS